MKTTFLARNVTKPEVNQISDYSSNIGLYKCNHYAIKHIIIFMQVQQTTARKVLQETLRNLRRININI